MEYYLAIDIGASSGRHILGWLEDGRLCTCEIYRFPNGATTSESGELCWDVNALWSHIKAGIRKAADEGKAPAYIGIDTWGVDFVLLDADGERIGEAVSYRSHRTDGMDAVLERTLTTHQLYARTGIQKQQFNTIYQLLALQEQHPDQLGVASTMLFIPDYFHYLLTGVSASEYTIATTSGLVTPATGGWDLQLIDRLGLPVEIFQPILPAGSVLGPVRADVAEEIGCQPLVVLPATHDTGSAVLALPTDREGALYLSSGTWSLMGVERAEADLSRAAEYYNFTNEGGYGGRYRFLRNIMGLWMIQSLRKECGYTFDQIMEAATAHLSTDLRVDVNNAAFLSPDSMTEALKRELDRPNLTLGELFAVVYLSLADCYAATVKQIEEIAGTPVSAIHIIGGGSKDSLLNRLTADASGKTVIAGPTEATAIGNLLCQLLGTGGLSTVEEARRLLAASIKTEITQPQSV
ncbi:MAG: rhamnulokinase [Clostridia bacterium]|nr:rhamnulokinase [Clostridia bacterium]